MATLLYNVRSSLRPSRVLSVMLADMLRDLHVAPSQSTPAFTPAADILEMTEGFALYVALPGVKRESVHVEFINGHLVISGERTNPAAAAKEAAATEKQLTDGILHLTLPFDTEKVTRYRIKIR